MKKNNSLFTRLITSHTIVVLIAVLAIGFAADTFFRLFLVKEESARLVDNVSSVVRRVVIPAESGWIMHSKQAIFINTLQLAGIEMYELSPSAVERLPFTLDEWSALAHHQQLFRKTKTGWFSLPHLELYLVDADSNRLLLLKNTMTKSADTLANMRRTIFYSGCLAIILSVFVSYGTTRYIVAPVRAIQQVARKIVQGDFRERVCMTSYDELDELATTFNQAVDQIEETLREQDRLEQLRKQFISNVSHEFRIPLTSLSGFLELMQNDKIPISDQQKVTRMMQKDVHRLSRLVDDLLDLSRLQSGTIELQRKHVQLDALIADTVERLRPEWMKKPLHVTRDVTSDLVVWADEDRLQQILLNLIGNAVHHSPPGEAVNIQAHPITESTDIEIRVINTGTTIPADDLPHIWDRFTKVDKSRSGAGTGLGLSITRELVHLHGGTIQASNLPDQSGVQFSFTLPTEEA